MGNRATAIRRAVPILLGVLLLAGLFSISLLSFLLFHTLVEIFTIIVAAGIFMIVWNARGYLHNNYLLFIGIAAVFVGFLDLLHTLAYQGMGIFADQTPNTATQLWVAGRYLQSLSLLIAPFLLGRKLKVELQIATYALITGLLIGSIFYWHDFPVAYVVGAGLTPFKVTSEFIVAAFFLAAIGLLFWKRDAFDPTVVRYLTYFLVLMVASEITFTAYVSVYGAVNAIGHILRLVAFFFLYKAVIETGLVKPYAVLLRDLKHSEDRLREHAAVLQSLNEDLERMGERLREDAANLQARNEDLDAYAHSVAHNLKNPLAVLVTTSEVITNVTDLTRKELREFTQQIRNTAYEMNSIIDNLLLLAEVRKTEAPLEPVDMDSVVTRVRERLSYMIKQHKAQINIPPAWPAAIGYAPWLEEVWANYLSNAIKYGGQPPHVELGAALQPDGMIRFWTRDDGIGLPGEDQARLFAPFTRVGQVHKPGHGLGLSIVLHIIEKLGGQVGVESEPGKGSLFYFTLPACPDGEEAEKTLAQREQD